MLDSLRLDFRFAWRSLRRQPSFTLIALLTLALGIGVTTLVFSLVHGVLLRPLPYDQPERIVEVWNHFEGSGRIHLAVPEFEAYRAGGTSFESFAAWAEASANVTLGDRPEKLRAVLATHDVFAVLGVTPLVGRPFGPRHELQGAEDVAVISHELWQRVYAGDPEVTARTIELDGTGYRILGVMPPDARMPRDHAGGQRVDVWLPLQIPEALRQHWGMHGLEGIARLHPSATLDEADTVLQVLVDRLRAAGVAGDNALSKPGFRVVLSPALDEVVGNVRGALLTVLAAVCLVLLITCANVANLALARGQRRRREMEVRAALGAGRGRLVRQLAVENLLLALTGGALGVGIAVGGLRLLQAFAPASLPRLDQLQPSAALLFAALLASVVAGLVFGLLPALQAGRAASRLHAAGARVVGNHRGQLALITAEVALAFVIVFGAGLLGKTLLRLFDVEPGYRVDNVLTFRVGVPGTDYPDSIAVAGFFTELRGRLAALPGVERVGAVSHLPLADSRGDWNFYQEGVPLGPDDPKPRGDWQVVTPGYFDTLGVALIEGRDLEERDAAGAPPVLLVNHTLAERYWPDASPVGTRVRLGGSDDNPYAEIIGVVGDIRHRSLVGAPVAEIYIPHAQSAAIMGRPGFQELRLSLRTAGDPHDLIEPARQVLGDLDPTVPLTDVRTMGEVRSQSLAVERFAALLLGSFAALALAIGAVGIYGVVAFVAVQRRREIAVRMALGADAGDVLRLSLRTGLVPTLAGVALGLPLAFAASRLLRALLFEVSPLDPTVLLAVAAVLVGTAILAAWVPSWRASRAQPAATLLAD